MRLVRGRPHPALAGMVTGYADFADRTREFRALAGVPPTAFPSVQDGEIVAA